MSLTQDMSDLYAIFERALALPRARRIAFLDGVCAGRPALRARIERLIAMTDDGGGFLDRSPLHAAIRDDVFDPAYDSGHRIGAYRLLRRLGAGGMAEVWLAERTEGGFHQRAAVKIILDARDSVSEHFATEREILASLVHPGIARLYDGGISADGSAYMIMEYVEGQHFIAYCNARRLVLGERLALFLQICDAVAYAHTHLVIHRDLKPANILVTTDGVVKLLDFGIAKVIDADGGKDSTRTLHMSPAYAAPEQLAGGRAGTAADVYALGVILFELLTGALPWPGEASSLATAVKRLLDTDAPLPSRVVAADWPIARRSIEGDLDAIVATALRREPAARYPDARVLADEIRRHLEHKPLSARAGARTYVLRRFLRRHWIGLTATAGLFVAMAVAIVAVESQARRVEREARRAAAVQSFMVDLFRTNSSRQPDPVKARQTTARELLDIGARRVTNGLSGAPADELALLGVFADLYHDLGLRAEELDLRRRAADLAGRVHGEDSRETADALVALAGAMEGSAAMDRRAATLARAKAILDARQDTTSRLRGRLLLGIAQDRRVSDLRAARAAARDAVAVFTRHAPSAYLAEAYYTLGSIVSDAGEPRQAIAPLRSAIDISRTVDGPGNPSLPMLYDQLAKSESDALQPAAAESAAREALRLAIAIDGEDHVVALRSHVRLGEVLVDAGRIREGLHLILSAKAEMPRLAAEGELQSRPSTLHASGHALHAAGDLDGALADLTASLAPLRRAGAPRVMVAPVLEDLADVLIDLGRPAEAIADIEEAARIRDDAGHPSHSRGVSSRIRMALDGDRLDEARTLLERLPTADGDEPRQWLANVRCALLEAEIDLRAGDVAAAADLAAAQSEEIRANALAPNLRILLTQGELIEGLARSRLGDAASSRTLLADALAVREELLLAKSPAIAEAELALAEGDLASGHIAEASAHIAKAQAIESEHSSLSARYSAPLERLRARAKTSRDQRDPSASYRSALAMTQSRSTVRSVTPSASAVSVSEKPAK